LVRRKRRTISLGAQARLAQAAPSIFQRLEMSNVDPQELAKFSELAHRWWDEGSEFRPLHEMNPLRLEWIDSQAGLADKAVLDIGCGGGILAEAMARRAAHVTGIDLAAKPLGVARLHALETGVENIDYREVSAEDLAAEQPESFDVITCMEMLEHVPEPSLVVQACARLVRPGGWVFFSTLNRNPKSFLLGIIGAEYVLQLLPRGTHEYARFIKPSELARWCRDAGLDLQASSGIAYNPLTRRFKLSDDTSVNYVFACRRRA
jgi:2-polyprenyl-6-hydroxyphenyl methylase / 3-demethylubiquinone-9 3-methyltransferase